MQPVYLRKTAYLCFSLCIKYYLLLMLLNQLLEQKLLYFDLGKRLANVHLSRQFFFFFFYTGEIGVKLCSRVKQGYSYFFSNSDGTCNLTHWIWQIVYVIGCNVAYRLKPTLASNANVFFVISYIWSCLIIMMIGEQAVKILLSVLAATSL